MKVALFSSVFVALLYSAAVALPSNTTNLALNGNVTVTLAPSAETHGFNVMNALQRLLQAFSQNQTQELIRNIVESLTQNKSSILYEIPKILGQNWNDVNIQYLNKSIYEVRQLFHVLSDENFPSEFQQLLEDLAAKNNSGHLKEISTLLGMNLSTVLEQNIDKIQQFMDVLKEPSYQHMVQELFANLTGSINRLSLLKKNRSNSIQPGLENLFNLLDVDKLMPYIQPQIERFFRSLTENGISSACIRDMMLTIDGVINGKQWALRMLDAFGKPGSELLDMKTKWLGSYDECTAVTATTYSNDVLKSDPEDKFRGKYCRVKVELQPMYIAALGRALTPSLDVGSCVADSCTASDIEGLILSVARLFNDTIKESPADVECQEEKPLKADAIGVICVLAVLAILLVLGTVYDVVVVQWGRNDIPGAQNRDPTVEQPKLNGEIQPSITVNSEDIKLGSINNGYAVEADEENKTKLTQTVMANGTSSRIPSEYVATIDTKTSTQTARPFERGTVEKMLLAFSVYTNGVKILSTNQAAGSLGAVNGIRFLSMAWVILGHTYWFAMGFDENAGQFIVQSMNNWTFMAIPYATVSVDTFFTLSGLLVAYLTLRELKKVKGIRHLNWFQFYFHRFWRLTPPYMLIMMVYAVLMKYWSSGPQWPQEQDAYSTYCNESWWTNLLYVNNLVKVKKMCMGWSWYLSNDMQFYVLSPLILIPIFYKVIVGGVVWLLFLAAAVITPALITYHHKYPAQLFSPQVTKPLDADYEKNLYLPCYTRMGPYIIGLFTGYLLYRIKLKCHIPKVLNLLGWLLSIGICCACVYGPYSDGNKHVLSVEESAAFYGLMRTGWGVAVSWIIFSCATGYGGWINELMSWKPFIPLGRLTYMAYLVHPIVMLSYYMSRRQLTYFNNYEVIYLFLAQLVMSYGVGFVASLAFEAPMMGLEKAIFRRDKK